MSVLRALYLDLQTALSKSKAVSLEEINFKLKVEDKAFAKMQGLLESGIVINKVEKSEPKRQQLPLEDSSRTVPMKEEEESTSMERGVDLGSRPLSSKEERSSLISNKQSVSVFLDSRSTSKERRSLVLEYEQADCRSVTIYGRIGEDGPRVIAKAWHASGIQLRVVFDRFEDSTRGFLDALFGHPYAPGLDTMALSNHRIVFSTVKTRLTTPYARAKIGPGINIVFDARPSPALRAMITTNTTDKKLTFFGVLPDKDDEEFILFTAPLFEFRSDSLRLKRTFIRINAGRRKIDGKYDNEDGGFRVANVTLRGSVTIAKEKVTLYARMVEDHELLQFQYVQLGQVVVPIKDLDPLMGGNSAWRDALYTRMRFSGNDALLEDYSRDIELSTGDVVHTRCRVGINAGAFARGKIVFEFKWLALTWVVGFPHDDAQIHVSGEGTANVLSTETEAKLPDVRMSLELLPAFEHTATFLIKPSALTQIRDDFGAEVHIHEASPQDPLVCCNLRFPTSGGPLLDVWPLENDA